MAVGIFSTSLIVLFICFLIVGPLVFGIRFFNLAKKLGGKRILWTFIGVLAPIVLECYILFMCSFNIVIIGDYMINVDLIHRNLIVAMCFGVGLIATLFIMIRLDRNIRKGQEIKLVEDHEMKIFGTIAKDQNFES